MRDPVPGNDMQQASIGGWRGLFKDPWLWINAGGLVVTLGITLGLAWVPSKETVQRFFQVSTFYFMLVIVLWWAISLWRAGLVGNLTKLAGCRLALVAALVLTGIIFSLSPVRFKVLTDEASLVGVSKMLYQKRLCAVPIRSRLLDSDTSAVQTVPAKRPPLFAFLLAGVHALKGYASGNGFVLNFILGVLFLGGLFVSARQQWGPAAGWGAMMLGAAAPGFWVYVTSSGFEVLNVLLVVMLFVLFKRFQDRERHDGDQVGILLLTMILVSYGRYESVLLGLVLMVMGGRPLWHEMLGRRLSPVVLAAPVMLLPLLWQRRFFLGLPEVNRVSLGVYEGFANPFGWQNLWAHLDANLFVLLGLNPHYGFSPLTAGLALIGAYGLSRKCMLGAAPAPQRRLWYSQMIAAALLLGLISSFYWGRFTLAMDNRLALVFLPFLVWPAAYVAGGLLANGAAGRRWVVALILVGHLAASAAYARPQVLVRTLALPFQYQAVRSMLQKLAPVPQETLIVDQHPNLYVIDDYRALSFDQFRREWLVWREAQPWAQIVAIQKIDPDSRELLKGYGVPAGLDWQVMGTVPVSSQFHVRVAVCRTPTGGPVNQFFPAD